MPPHCSPGHLLLLRLLAELFLLSLSCCGRSVLYPFGLRSAGGVAIPALPVILTPYLSLGPRAIQPITQAPSVATHACCCCCCRRWNRILDTFDAWLRHALGIRRIEDHQPVRDNDHFVEASDGPGQMTDQSRADKDEDFLAPYGGEQCDRSQDRSPGRSPDQGEEWFQGGRDNNAESEVVRGEETRQESPGSKAHYYLKFSSTVERPNRFVDRSLPFFVPPAQPL